MKDVPEWAILAFVAVLTFASISYGIDCIRDANSVIRRCRRMQRKAEKAFLDAHPLCMVCEHEGKYRKATQVWIETNGNMQARCEEHCKGAKLENDD